MARVNLVGKGPWARNIKRTLLEMGDEVPVVADRESGWRAAFEGAPDSICVAAHPAVNLPVVLECNKLRIPVWIEKPAALSLAEVEQMAACEVPIFVDYTYAFYEDQESGLVDLLAGVLSGRQHNWGALYDWAPHALCLALCPVRPRQPAGRPLQNALELFVRSDPALWPPFGLTLKIHQIIDQAEKLHASR